MNDLSKLAQLVAQGKMGRREFLTRAVKLGVSAAVASSFLAACAPTPTEEVTTEEAAPAAETTEVPTPIREREVSLWHIYTGVGGGDVRGIAFEAVVKEFEKTHPGIKVSTNAVYHEDAKVIFPNVIKTSNPPDVVQLREYTIARPAYEAGLIKDITDLWEKNNWDDAFGSMSPTLKWKGKNYFIPFELGTFNGLMYVTDLKDKFDFQDPKLFSEFETIMQTMKDAGVPAIIIANKEKWWAPIVLQCILEGVTAPETYDKLIIGEAHWTDPNVIEAFKVFADWLKKGYFYPDMNAYSPADIFPIWTEGKGAFLYAGPWAGGVAKEAGKQYDYFPWPVKDPSIPQRVNGNGEPFSIAANAPHPEEAELLLTFLASKEAQQIFADEYNGLVCNKYVDYSKQEPIVQKMIKDMQRLTFVTHMNWDVPLPVNTALLAAVSEFVADPSDKMIDTKSAEIERVAKEYWEQQA